MILDLDYKEIEVVPGVTVQAKTLESRDFQEIARLAGASLQAKDEVASGLAQLSNETLTVVAGKILPKYCVSLKGVDLKENGASRPATVEDLTKYGAFLPWCLYLLIQLFQLSTLSAEESDTLKK